MVNIVLYQPEIPPNTGNIIRLSANTGAALHLIKPYGFDLSDKQLRRAGLDYQHLANVYQYESFAQFIKTCQPKRLFTISTKGEKIYTKVRFQAADYLLFGSETKGLPDDIREQFMCLTIPMSADNRSLNLSNSVAIVVYEAWRQLGFKQSCNN